MNQHSVVWLLVVVTVYCLNGVCAAPSLVVQTQYGKVSGFATDTHQIWKGIPFAAPPVGHLRWKPPQPPTPWNEVLPATKFGPVCYGGGGGQSEDCLYLNVWVPLNTPNGKLLPVIVWLYGGGFIGGSATGCPGDFLSGGDTVVVTLNYRLGTLGFLYHPALMNATYPTSGFYGLQDQRAAFQWVQKNIAAFGGDPAQVSIAGESAGAISVCVHLAAMRSAGLFSRAIMESGFCTLRTVNQSNIFADQILTAVGCKGSSNVLSCLLSKSASDLMAAPGNIPSFMPTLDPYELDAQPSVILSRDRKSWNAVPLLAGVNHDENSMWLCSDYGSISDAEYKATLVKLYGQANADQIYRLYPTSAFPSASRALIDATTDVSWKCPNKKLVSQVTAVSGLQAFLYSFNVWQSDPCKGAQHSDELKFVFYGMDSPADAKNLSTIMRAAWTSFARGSTTPVTTYPNLVWKPYDTTNQYFMQFNYTSQLGELFQQKECDFWDRLQASPQYQNIDLQEYTLCFFQNCYYG